VLERCRILGIKLAVYSNKSDHFANQVVRSLLAEWPWAAIRGQRPDVPRKPAPDGAILVAAELGVAAADCWFVGDSGVDIDCARGAQMRSFGCLWGFRTREELVQAGADHLVNQPRDLLAFLGEK
jgi:phosphoglycolate phosphatase